MRSIQRAGCLMLAGAMLLGAGPLTQAEEKEAEAVRIVEFTPGSPGEEEFLFHAGTAFQIQEGADGYFRISDLNDAFIYAFDGAPGDKAFVALTISCQYTVAASTDNEAYTTVLTNTEKGDTRECRGIDLTPYFENSSRVYLRFTDTDPSDGWGTQLYKTKFVRADGSRVSGGAWEDISADWTTSDGAGYTAGTALQASPGAKVIFTRQVTMPAWWQGAGMGLSFSGVESGKTPVIKIDGEPVSPSIASGRTYVVKAPASCAGRTVTVQVETTATAEGTAGLWNSVKAGCTDLIAYPDAARTFGDTTRKLSGNYDGCDFVTLNALAGNYATTLIDSRFNITGFDAGLALRNQFFAHDTSRTLLALADEETYSPIVRLDAIRALYQGVKSALVPGSDYEIFLKRDFASKVVRQSRTDSRKLEWWSVFDAVEVFTDMAVTTGEQTLDAMTVTEMASSGGNSRLDGYADGQGGKVEVLSKWYGGMEDKPTTSTFTAAGTDRFTVSFDNFDGRISGSRLPYVGDETGDVASAFKKTKSIDPPSCGYLFLRNKDYLASGFVLVWDVAPEKILLETAEDGQAFSAVRLVYAGDKAPTLSAVKFQSFDNNCDWPRRLAKNIRETGTYGAGGFDPSYACDLEGLGPEGLAAAAYILKKYGDPLAGEAERLALKAMEAGMEAAARGNNPSFCYYRVAACDYLVRLGHTAYREKAHTCAALVYNEQNKQTGAFNWFDARNPMTLLRAYDLTGDEKYKDALEKYKAAVVYMPNMILYKGEAYQSSSDLIFAGAGDLGYLAHMGDVKKAGTVMTYAKSMSDSGVHYSSDLNPYFMGWSLKGLMEVSYPANRKKQIIGAGEFVLYTADGKVEVLSSPTCYINNPYSIHNP